MEPRFGGYGVIEDGMLKGRQFIIPSVVYVERGQDVMGVKYARACLIHQKFIPDQGCEDCKKEVTEEQAKAKAIGLV